MSRGVSGKQESPGICARLSFAKNLSPSPGLSFFTFKGSDSDLESPSNANTLLSKSMESTPSVIKCVHAYRPEAFSLPRVNLKQLLHIRSNFMHSGDSTIT